MDRRLGVIMPFNASVVMEFDLSGFHTGLAIEGAMSADNKTLKAVLSDEIEENLQFS